MFSAEYRLNHAEPGVPFCGIVAEVGSSFNLSLAFVVYTLFDSGTLSLLLLQFSLVASLILIGCVSITISFSIGIEWINVGNVISVSLVSIMTVHPYC